uniref:histone H2A-Bbd type 1-like n=1 Tax=Jaculus jaculus TaxID=51337 RepID=UPI000332EBAD|nr:histone H2A-Bbd type 1-like [Jaculus jaculus]
MAERRRSQSCKPKKQSTSRSTRAELQFPISRVERFLRDGNYSQRLSSSTPVFLTGVLEYLTSNILDLAGKEAHNKGKKRITPEHIQKVVQDNQQLQQLFEDDTKTLIAEVPEVMEN